MLGDSVVDVKHCMNPKSGTLSKQTLGMFGIGAASLLTAAISFGVSVHTAAENKAGLQRTIAEHRPAYSYRPEVLSQGWDFAAFGGFALGMSTLIAGLARARSEKRNPAYTIGTAPNVQCAVEDAPAASFPLVAPSADGEDFVFNYGAGIEGELMLDGTSTSLADLVATGRAKPSMAIAGALELPIPSRAKIRAKAGQTTFMVSAVAQPREQPVALFDRLEARTLKYFAGALAFHMAVIAIANTIPSDDSSVNIDVGDTAMIDNKFIDSAKEDMPPEPDPDAENGTSSASSGVDAKKMKLDEGQAGDHDSTDTNKHLAVKDMKTPPQITREEAIHSAQVAGILGSLSSPDRNFNALVDETGISSGFDNVTFYGNLYGADAGTAHGEFGGGLIGFGRGGGCVDAGECGLIGGGGRFNTIGNGKHAGQGWGPGGTGIGRMPNHVAQIPVSWHGTATIVGGLDKAIIKRYIKMNIEKISYCYEHELIARPNLEGSVNISFFISPTGAVTSAGGKGFDSVVDDCVAGVIQRIEFPKPSDGGGVNVTYPFTFHATK
ncbi:MAG: AgmX/PglI C-terminal domain-containing protein [Kofleriaceae bacterium]